MDGASVGITDGSGRPAPDRYLVPHVRDFSTHLARRKVFSKVDVIRGYHQIPGTAENIPKTAIVTPFGQSYKNSGNDQNQNSGQTLEIH